MRRYLYESVKSDITRTLINNGFNIRNCSVKEFDDAGNYRIEADNHKDFSYLGLEYSVSEQKFYVDYVERDAQEEIEEEFKFPSELPLCIKYWNDLV